MGLKLNVVVPVAGVFVVAPKKHGSIHLPYQCFLEKSCLDEHLCHFWDQVPTNPGRVSNKEFGLD